MLADIDLDIASGQRVLLAGPSGAGKSTLLRALAGVLHTVDSGHLSGELLVGGAAPGQRPGQAGLLLQDPADALVAGAVGRDVAFGPENVGLARSAIWERVTEALRAVNFPYGASHPSAHLSGGEAQRLTLAGALALQPGLLLLDEPTAMLDPPSAREVRQAVLAAVASSGSTLVVVEHALAPWVDQVDRLVVLSAAGRVIADGRPHQVFEAHGESLAAQGIWVPGLPAPVPIRLPADLAGPWRGRPADGTTMLRAEDLDVRDRLAPLTMSLPAGRITAMRGRSGAGKSTALAALAGRLPSGAGRVVAEAPLAGDRGGDPMTWTSRELAARIGWLSQHVESTFIGRTVRGEVLAGLRGGADPGRPTAAAVARADGLLAALSLQHLAGRDPYRLSGGEQRRLAVAAALAQGPGVLLADEPTLGQDRNTWAAVAGALDCARAGGTAVAVATHDTILIAELADSVVELSAPAGAMGAGGADRRWPPAQRCGPLAVLAASLLAVAGSLFVRSWEVGLVVVAVVALLSPLAIRSPKRAALRTLPGLVAAASIGWSSWLLGGRDIGTGVCAGLRILVFVVPGALLTAQLDPSRLGDDLAQRLRLPARPVVAAVAALQRLEDLAAVWAAGAWARRVRGLGPGRSPGARLREVAALTFGLLVQTLRRSARMAVAMDARGFAGARRRTWAERSRWGAADGVLVLIGSLLLVVPIVLDVTWM